MGLRYITMSDYANSCERINTGPSSIEKTNTADRERADDGEHLAFYKGHKPAASDRSENLLRKP